MSLFLRFFYGLIRLNLKLESPGNSIKKNYELGVMYLKLCSVYYISLA